MKIRDDFEFDDLVTGLRMKVIRGIKLDRLHIEMPDEIPRTRNRDFFFARDGEFDGTGSAVTCEPVAGPGDEER